MSHKDTMQWLVCALGTGVEFWKKVSLTENLKTKLPLVTWKTHWIMLNTIPSEGVKKLTWCCHRSACHITRTTGTGRHWHSDNSWYLMLFFKDMHSNCQVLINFPNALESSDWKVDIVKHTLKMVKGNEKDFMYLPKAIQYI